MRALLKQALDALEPDDSAYREERVDRAIDALRAELAKPDQDYGKVIGELECLYKNAIKREFDLSQALEAAVDNNLDKLMAMSDEQIRALAGFEGHHPDDLAALARQTFEIALLKAELAKPDPEPVGYVYWNKGHAEGALDNQNLKPGTPLYAAPTEPNCRFPTCHSQEFQSKLANEVVSELITHIPAPRGFIAQPSIDGVVRTGTTNCSRHPNAPSTTRPPTPTGWSDTDWLNQLEVNSHPLAGQHINQGSMDAAADAYEAEYLQHKLGPEQTRNCSRHPDAPHGPDGDGCKCHSWAPGEAS